MSRCRVFAFLGATVLAVAVIASPGAAQVKINEVGLGTPDWVELVNWSQNSINIGGWVLRNGYDTGSGFVEDASYTFPAGTQISGQGYLVVEEYGGGAYACSLPTGFNFFWTGARTLAVLLEDDNGDGHDYVFKDYGGIGGAPLKPPELQWFGTLSAVGDVCARIQDQDTNRASDWREDLAVADATPCGRNPGQSGDGSPFRKVMITEACSGNPDWVEITNFSLVAMNLGGWQIEWHDTSSHTGVLPLGTSIAPAESIIVLETGSPTCPGAPAGAQQLPVIAPFVTIQTNPFSVCLFDASGVQVDEVRVSSTGGTLPTAVCDGPWRGIVDRSGTTSAHSVERVWGLDSDAGRDWTAGAIPSCGRESTSAGPRGTDPWGLPIQILINEIDDDPDRIELYNADVSAVDLADWFLITSGRQDVRHFKITPFVRETILLPGSYIVISDYNVPPPGLVGPFISVYPLGQNISLSTTEFSCALYDRYGRVVDVVRTTRKNCDWVHNHPRAPSHPSDWLGAARRVSWSTTAVARRPIADTHRGSDWGIGDPPTWGTANSPVLGTGHGDELDVRQNQTGLPLGLAVIFNAGPAKAGYVHHLFISIIPTSSCGGFLGLGPDAILNIGPIFGVPPFTGFLDADGSARLDIDPGLMPSLNFKAVWVLADLAGYLDSRTLVLEYDNSGSPMF